MKKNKIFIIVLLFFAVFSISSSNILAADEPLKSWPGDTGSEKIDTVYNSSSKVWTTVKTVAQVAAFSGIIFAGLRYMFASSEERADIKKSMLVLVIGMILIFGASVVVDIVIKITSQAL